MPPVRETRLVVIYGGMFFGCVALAAEGPPAVWAFCFALSHMLTVTALTSDDSE